MVNFEAKAKAFAILNALNQNPSRNLIKQASSGNGGSSTILNLMKAIVEALSKEGVAMRLSESDLAKSISQEASVKASDDEDHSVNIPSKSIRDSHYLIDISKNAVTKNGKSVIMVSLFMRDGYIGQYMIKRNFFYLSSNQSEAKETYQELVRKSEKIKKRYLEDQIQPQDLLSECKQFLSSIKGDFDFEEDILGTTVKRN